MLRALTARTGDSELAYAGEVAAGALGSIPEYARYKVTNLRRAELAGQEAEAGEPTIAGTIGIDRQLSTITRLVQARLAQSGSARPIFEQVKAIRERIAPEAMDDFILEEAWSKHLPEEMQ